MSVTDDLQEFKDLLGLKVFGMTACQAIEAEICICCKEPAKEKNTKPVDWDEYYISGMCGECFEEVTQDV